MSAPVYQEAVAGPPTASVPLSHLSIELGHLYLEDFAGGLPVLTRMMRQVAPWASAMREAVTAQVAPRTARISTCFLVDDYFSPVSPPDEVVPLLLRAAEAAGLTIDYLVRESACAVADEVAVAELVVGRLVTDPPPGANGSRPPTQTTGWLCNGVRSPQPPETGHAMRAPVPWQPPSENGANRHSVFIDVELWSELTEGRQYSCAFLASVWQLLRLGLLRLHSSPVAAPQAWTGDLPSTWAGLPPVTRLNPQARPFAAYRTYSVLASRFLGIEHAVRTILSQVSVEQDVLDQVHKRASDEDIHVPQELVDRVEYTFTGPTWT